MPRVVLDTDVLISGLCFGGPPGKVLQAAVAGRFEMFTSADLIAEFERVMRLKFPGKEGEVAETVVELAAFWGIVPAGPRLRVIAQDPADDRVLECAVAAEAGFIVSGDRHLLALGRYGDIRILAPTDFLAELARRSAS